MIKAKAKSISSEDNMLAKYLKNIDKIDILSREEETILAKAAFYGDKEAQKKLIQSNLRFVVNIAKNYQKRGLPLIDLINEGNIGLINASKKFDYRKGYRFISYAVWWIRQSILKALAEKTKLIRLPLNRTNQLLKIDKYKKERLQEADDIFDDMDIYKIANELDFKVEDVSNILNAVKDYVPIDTFVNVEDGMRRLSDTIEDNSYKRPEEYAIEDSLRKVISEVLNTLPRKEREVLILRFGLEGKPPMSLKEVGDIFNLTKERIRQIEKSAIKRLSYPKRSVNLKIFLSN